MVNYICIMQMTWWYSHAHQNSSDLDADHADIATEQLRELFDLEEKELRSLHALQSEQLRLLKVRQ
jgi:hypothetical protein